MGEREMEKFVSVWADGKTLPESYIFPAEQRPGDELAVQTSNKTIPLIDLQANGNDHAHLVRHIITAFQHFGSFQVINHGVPRRLMDEVRGVFKEFFELPVEENSKFCSNDENQMFYLYTSSNAYDKEKLHFWRDVLRQRCTPLEECMPHWPQKPPRYREVVAEYVTKVNEIGSRLMELICEGVGLEPKYLEEKLSLESRLVANHYPPCPDPRLTLGVGKHSDRSIISILMQGEVPGLQILNNGEWVGVDPNPDALVITVGYILQAVTNGKLRSGDHRVVTNAKKARESVSLFILPKLDCLVEPAKPLVSKDKPPLYKGFRFQDLLMTYSQVLEPKIEESPLKHFQIN